MLGRLSLILMLLAATLAGCVSTPETPAATVAPTPPVNLTRPEVQVPKFLPPVELGVVTGGSEPNVGVAKDGTVYVTTPLAIWRSDDAGKSFKPVGKPDCALLGIGPCLGSETNPGLKGGGDGAITVTANGTLLWAGLAGGQDGEVPVQLSTDKGESWSKPVDAAKGNSSDREWVAVNRTGTMFVQWRDFGSVKDTPACSDPTGNTCAGAPSGILVRASDDGGQTWRPATRVADDGHQGPIAPDPSGDWLFLPHVNNSNQLLVARSHDGGFTWEDVKAAPLAADTFQFPIAAVDQAGTAYVAYATGTLDPTQNYQADRFINAPAVHLIVSKDHGATWSKPVQISPDGVPAVFPWIVAGAPGHIAAAWYEGTSATPTVAPNVWHVKVVMSTTADLEKPVFKGAYVTDTPNHVGHICVVGSACFPAQDRSLLDFFEIRLLPDGSPVLAFVGDGDVRLETVKVYATRMTEGTSLL